MRPATFAPLALLAACAPERSMPEQPDIVLVSLDTVRWDRTSLGGQVDSTPNLARLAASPGAVEFTHAWSAAAWSLPAYTSMFTGRDAPLHGVGFTEESLDPNQRTLAEVLSIYGYETAGFSSGPHLDATTGLARGFSTWSHTRNFASMGPAVGRALEWVGERSAEAAPFFLFVQGYDAHAPYSTPSAFAELFDPDYDGAIHQVSDEGRRPCQARLDVETCIPMPGEARPEVLRQAQAEAARTALLVGPHVAWVHGPGTKRVQPPPEQPNSGRLLRELVRHRKEQPGRALDAEQLAERWTPQERNVALDAGQVAAALADLRALGLGPLLLEQDGAVMLDPEIPLKSVPLLADLAEDDVAHITAHYDASVMLADYHLGRLLHGLEQQGALDDAVVIVLGDHGESLGEEGVFGHDTEVGDPVFHVPLVVRLPTGAPARRTEEVVSLVDLTPSLVELVGATPLAGIEGRSFAAHLRDPAAPVEDEQVAAASLCCFAVRTDDSELIARRDPQPVIGRDGFIRRPESLDAALWGPMHWELHHVEEDTLDITTADLAREEPEEVEALRHRLDAWPDEPGADPEAVHGPAAEAMKEQLRARGYWTAGEAEEQSQ